MPTSMGVASLKFSKSDRKPKKTKRCTIPIPRKKKKTKSVPEKGNCPDKVHVANQNAIKKMYQTKIEENLYYKEGK